MARGCGGAASGVNVKPWASLVFPLVWDPDGGGSAQRVCEHL